MAEVTPEGKLLNVIKKAQGKMRLKKELKVFTKLNFILVSLIAVILIVFLIDVFTPDYKPSEFKADMPKEEENLPVVKDWNADEEVKGVIEEKRPISKEELTKDLNLLGIVTGDNNQAIIEDRKASKTFFLYKGDSFREFKVYDIKDSEIILEYKGEKIELKM